MLTEGYYDEAIRDLSEAIKLNPNYTKPYNNLCFALAKTNDIDQLGKVIKLWEKHDSPSCSLYCYSYCYYKVKRQTSLSLEYFNHLRKSGCDHCHCYNLTNL